MTLMKVIYIWLMLTQLSVLLTLSLRLTLMVLLCPSPSLEDQRDLTTRDSGESYSFKLVLFISQGLLTFALFIAIKLVVTRPRISRLYASGTRTRLPRLLTRLLPRLLPRPRLRPRPRPPELLCYRSPLPVRLLFGLLLNALRLHVTFRHGSKTICQGQRRPPSHREL